MPIYEYECEDCKKKVEILHKRLEQKEDINCPDCGSNKMKKLVSLPFINTNSPLDVAKKKAPTTCCGKDTPCTTPPCSTDGTCKTK